MGLKLGRKALREEDIACYSEEREVGNGGPVVGPDWLEKGKRPRSYFDL
jgi:hypothetical protein